ncbi:MAG TPA: hypothetical protein VEF72_27475 [Mycobacterium sp.]|nr:hypothetical protein [Mycobacterium sp.]
MAITRFSQFLTTVGVEHIGQLDRGLLERYLADLAGEHHPQWRSTHIGLLNALFAAIRQHRWHPGLPATAVVLSPITPAARKDCRGRWPSR